LDGYEDKYYFRKDVTGTLIFVTENLCTVKAGIYNQGFVPKGAGQQKSGLERDVAEHFGAPMKESLCSSRTLECWDLLLSEKKISWALIMNT